jgi:hypothetical protein
MPYCLRTVWVPDAEDRRLEAAGYLSEEECSRALSDSIGQIRHLASCHPTQSRRHGARAYLHKSLVASLAIQRYRESDDDREYREAMRNPNSEVSRSIMSQIDKRREERSQADMIRMGIPIEEESTTPAQSVSTVSRGFSDNPFLANLEKRSRR